MEGLRQPDFFLSVNFPSWRRRRNKRQNRRRDGRPRSCGAHVSSPKHMALWGPPIINGFFLHSWWVDTYVPFKSMVRIHKSRKRGIDVMIIWKKHRDGKKIENQIHIGPYVGFSYMGHTALVAYIFILASVKFVVIELMINITHKSIIKILYKLKSESLWFYDGELSYYYNGSIYRLICYGTLYNELITTLFFILKFKYVSLYKEIKYIIICIRFTVR